MWFVKALLVIVVLAAILYFAMLNQGEQVDIYLKGPTAPTFTAVPLPWVLLVAFGAGVIVWFFVSLLQVLTARSEVAVLRRKNRQLTRELNDLRNMTVRDLDPEILPAPEESDSAE